MWVVLIEKAWSKLFGNYAITEYEVVDYAMEDVYFFFLFKDLKILGAPA